MNLSTRLLPAATLVLTLSSPAVRPSSGLTVRQATQQPQAVPPTAASPQALSPQVPSPPSALLQPALSSLRDAIAILHVDKWKVPGAIRQKTDANVSSIQRDLDDTLPGLLTKADAASSSVSQVLPLSRNVDALYDVVLRVANTAELAAPGPQSASLNDALSKLESARRSLGERLQTLAMAQDRQVKDLQSALSVSTQPSAAPAACPQPVAPKAGAAPTHAKKVKKPAAKTTTPGSSTTPAAPKQ